MLLQRENHGAVLQRVHGKLRQVWLFWLMSLPAYLFAGMLESITNPEPGGLIFGVFASALYWLVWPLYLVIVMLSFSQHVSQNGLSSVDWGLVAWRFSFAVPGLVAFALVIVNSLKVREPFAWYSVPFLAGGLWLLVRALSGYLTPKGYL